MIAARIALAVLLILCATGCAEFQRLPAEERRTVYVAQGFEGSLLERYAPVVLTYGYGETFNRIGKPTAALDEKGREVISVDPARPVIYYLMRTFSTQRGTYTNLIYRVHFPEVPYSLIPFHLTAGRNVGLLVVVTLDARDRPVLVTTVHTCGCYVAAIPTSFLAEDSLPRAWRDQPLNVWGEQLPARVDYGSRENPRLLVHLRPGVHRVTNLEIVDEGDLLESPAIMVVRAPLMPVGELDRLPLDGRRTSFFYQEGLREGHVKGSIKPWESLLLSLLSLDPLVGSDKAYGDRRETGNPFYTSLKPWNREASDMWDFPGFLTFWGWRL
jgi:hypothetical protein